jgi:hypothetical protein
MKTTLKDLVAKKPIFRAVNTQLRSLDESARTIDFVSSTETADRYGDVIRVNGWQLGNFQKNPVFLFSHRSEDPPIGKVLQTTKEMGAQPALVQKVQFATKDVYPFADTIFKLYQSGFMRAVSVGFMPKEYQPIIEPDDQGGRFLGYEFLEQELFELSGVPVPANPEALGKILRASVTGNQFDGKKLGEMFLHEAAERSIITADEAGAIHKFICGDKNPPWAYSIEGVTFTDDADAAPGESKSFGEWKEASSKCVKSAEKLVERVERAVAKFEELTEESRERTDAEGESKAVQGHKTYALSSEGVSTGHWVCECGADLGDCPVDEIDKVFTAHQMAAEFDDGRKKNVATLEELLRGSKSDADKAFFSATLLAYSGADSTQLKGYAVALDYVQSAHKDVSRAHAKMALAIGHMSAEANPDGTGDPDDPNEPPATDPNDSQTYSAEELLEKTGLDGKAAPAEPGEDVLGFLSATPEKSAASESVGRDAELPVHQTAHGGKDEPPTSDPLEPILRALE